MAVAQVNQMPGGLVPRQFVVHQHRVGANVVHVAVHYHDVDIVVKDVLQVGCCLTAGDEDDPSTCLSTSVWM